MKVIIAGGRDFRNEDLLDKEVTSILNSMVNIPMKEMEIVSGGQRMWDKEEERYYGADYIGEIWAIENGFKLTKFPADWKKFGKAGGPIRNEAMSKYANMLILFWDGISKGSESMLKYAQKENLIIHIIKY